MRIVTIGATHDHPTSLPAVEPLAVTPVSPRACLTEMALGTQPVALVEARVRTAFESQLFHIFARMAGGAASARLLRVHRLDILMGIRNPLRRHDQLPAEMA